MKQLNKNLVEYFSLGSMHTPTENDKKARAFAYTHVLTALNDVGCGADDCLNDIRQIIATIKNICLEETGYEIESYNTELVGCDYSGWKSNPYKKQKVNKELKQ